MIRLACALILALTTGACAGLPSCPVDTRRSVTAHLYFAVTDDVAWARFLDDEVTHRFPDGLSVMDVAGQWRDQTGAIGRERSKMLVIILPGRADDQARLEAIRTAYKTQFHQQSVLLERLPGCAGF